MKNSLSNMKCLDLFISSQNEEEYKSIQHLITPSETIAYPILSFDFYANNFSTVISNSNKKNDINKIKEFATKFGWNNSIDEIFKNHTFETIVLTSKQQEIIWVNDGFKKMTGYSKNYAINKTPSFLQGAETCEKTKKRIRKKLRSNKPFTDLVINYKKDQTTYECEITVFPLHNKDTTHYIALEKAI
jgi:PAS domain S-box-containing protein